MTVPKETLSTWSSLTTHSLRPCLLTSCHIRWMAGTLQQRERQSDRKSSEVQIKRAQVLPVCEVSVKHDTHSRLRGGQ